MGFATPRPGAYPLQEHHDLLSAYHCKCGARDKLRPIQNSVSGSPSSAALWPDLFMRISGFEGARLQPCRNMLSFMVALDSLSKVKVKVKIKVKSCWGRGIKAFPCHRCHAATPVGTASDGQTRAPSNSASCLNMPKTACSSLRMTATSASILHLPRSCRAR